jgi:hypothetical protein
MPGCLTSWDEQMNLRIKQLIEKATNPDYDGDEGPMNELNVEKFAELIVGECVNMIEAAAENADEEDVHGMRNAAGLISRAFITFYDADLKNE